MSDNLAFTHAQLCAKPSRRLIGQAMKNDEVLSATFIGQHRARAALEFGLGVKSPGYNLYVMGEQATGRFTLVHEYIAQQVEKVETPNDWCYINNFDDEREPFILRLKPGESKQFSRDMVSLIDDLLDTFPAAFDNPGYQRKLAAIEKAFQQRYDAAINAVEQFAQSQDVALYEDGGTISFSPIVDGKPLTDAEFTKLSEDKRQHFYALIGELETRLSDQLIELPRWKRESSERRRELKSETVEQGIRPMLKDLEHKYANELGIIKFLHQMKPELIETLVEIMNDDSGKDDDKSDDVDRRALLEEQFLPNVLTAHVAHSGAPVVYEPNPTYQHLFGRVEYSNQQGSVYTNYRMIRPGALHKANGGYLLLDADKMVHQPYVWEALKLALKQGELPMEMPQQELGMVNSMMLNPQAIPLNIKVVLLGSRELYYDLQELDDEFQELFRVLVDFDHDIPLDKSSLFDFIGKVRNQVHLLGLKGISTAAMTRLVEFSLRLAEHQEKLSARFADVIELLHEAHYFCVKQQHLELDVRHLEQAMRAKTQRNNRISEFMLEEIKEGQIIIATQGKAVGKVNGLTVLDIGDSVFGTPARISATVYAGSNGVVDIEREVELGQPIHSKGVMLLTGYLGDKYAQHFPLTLSANIALEQSYGHIDGDSASLGELVALISALTGIPARQEIAVTGSINQYGQVQSVGGINEKIEGFFTLCEHRGLTGNQGVVIPRSNQKNLMLNREVREAVKKGCFHIYGVETVDEALGLLMGMDPGTLTARGRYPKGSINSIALARLHEIAMIVSGGDGE